MSEEAAGLFRIHASSAGVIVILLHAYSSDFRIACLRMHENHTADARFRCHGIALCQLYAHALMMPSASAAAPVSMAVLMTMWLSMLQHTKHLQNITLHRMIRTARISGSRLNDFGPVGWTDGWSWHFPTPG